MKNLAMSALLVGAVVLAGPTATRAMSKEAAAALGFVGGLVLASAACGSSPIYCETVVVESAPCCWCEYRVERVWVPGYWVWVRGPCCRMQRVWQPGYFETRRVRAGPCGHRLRGGWYASRHDGHRRR